MIHQHQLDMFDNLAWNQAERQIFNLMRDERWHPAQELIELTGQREALRRMRALRERPEVRTIEKQRNGASRDYFYRLILSQ